MHRVRQGVAYLGARDKADDAALARDALPAAAFALWREMPVADRRHGADVARRLRGLGIDDDELIAAALLHDAAKGRRMRLWHRSAAVILEALVPRLLARIAEADPRSWRHPFYLYLHHASMSADAARAAGCSSRTAAFIRGNAERETDAPLLALLRAADEAS